MALSKIDVANMVTGAVPVANGGTALTSGFQNGVDPRPSTVPIIQNGDMAVSQRATSVTGITDDGYKLCDRWYEYLSSLGTYTFAQEAQTSGNAFDNGFRTAFRIDCTTADASPGASDEFWWGIKLEGQDLQMFKKGSSNAEKFTLAFWVKSNKTGTGQVNFRDTDNSRMCSGTYTISSANTWEHKIINIAADTTGAFTNDNAESLQIQWYLDSGSNFEGGAAPTAWEAEASADRNASGNLNIGDNTANDWSITGIQLEVGEFTSSTLPPFQHESYKDNLMRCARYFFRSDDDYTKMLVTGVAGSDQGWYRGELPVPLRTTGTFTTYALASQASSGNVHRHENSTDVEAISGTYSGQDSFQIYRSRSSSGHNYSIQSFDASAEL
jgi:hypothetical protein